MRSIFHFTRIPNYGTESYITDRAVIRLKRVNRGHLACNIKTKQQRRYYWHYPIDGVKDGATRLTCGYVLDPTQTHIAEIVVSLQYGLEDLVWSFILDDEAHIMPVPVPEPSPVLPPEAPTVDEKPKVRPKGSRKAQEQ